jgi:hypothetical protein
VNGPCREKISSFFSLRNINRSTGKKTHRTHVRHRLACRVTTVRMFTVIVNRKLQIYSFSTVDSKL